MKKTITFCKIPGWLNKWKKDLSPKLDKGKAHHTFKSQLDNLNSIEVWLYD